MDNIAVDEQLHEKIMEKARNSTQVTQIRTKPVYALAASFCLIMAVSVFAIFNWGNLGDDWNNLFAPVVTVDIGGLGEVEDPTDVAIADAHGDMVEHSFQSFLELLDTNGFVYTTEAFNDRIYFGEAAVESYNILLHNANINTGEPEIIHFWSFENAEMSEKNSNYISPSGFSTKYAEISWAFMPHWFRAHNPIILYVGEDEAILRFLRTHLGNTFSGCGFVIERCEVCEKIWNEQVATPTPTDTPPHTTATVADVDDPTAPPQNNEPSSHLEINGNRFRVVNNRSLEIYFNGEGNLSVWLNGKWVHYESFYGREWAGEWQTVKPGSKSKSQKVVWGELPAGRYQFWLEAGFELPEDTNYSSTVMGGYIMGEFTIDGPPELIVTDFTRDGLTYKIVNNTDHKWGHQVTYTLEMRWNGKWEEVPHTPEWTEFIENSDISWIWEEIEPWSTSREFKLSWNNPDWIPKHGRLQGGISFKFTTNVSSFDGTHTLVALEYEIPTVFEPDLED
jgi:hypothetical protein